VKDPVRGIDVLERRRAMLLVRGDEEAKKGAAKGGDLPLAALGSGSDYSPFLQHLGIASLNLSFGGEGQYGQYHSIYDSFDHYVRFVDPGFRYGVALAQVAGRATLRLADADVLPFRAAPLVETIEGYVDELEKLVDDRRKKTEEQNRLVREGRFVAAAPPDETYVPPPLEREVPHLNFAPLRNALDELHASAPRLDDAMIRAGAASPEARRALNRALASLERAMTRKEGLPGRPWYVHQVYAPGFYTGYGVKTLPAVRESIEQKRWDEVDDHIATTAAVLSGLAHEMSDTAALVGE
jgi:N-acetylated-alpha-linked acidic dipeptidase